LKGGTTTSSSPASRRRILTPDSPRRCSPNSSDSRRWRTSSRSRRPAIHKSPCTARAMTGSRFPKWPFREWW